LSGNNFFLTFDFFQNSIKKSELVEISGFEREPVNEECPMFPFGQKQREIIRSSAVLWTFYKRVTINEEMGPGINPSKFSLTH
jgi:hypothetical protein